MRVRLQTTFAHPKYGVAFVGQVLDLPEADARVLLESGHIDPLTKTSSPAAVLVSDDDKQE